MAKMRWDSRQGDYVRISKGQRWEEGTEMHQEEERVGGEECTTNYLPTPAKCAADFAISFTPEILNMDVIQFGVYRDKGCGHHVVFARAVNGGRSLSLVVCIPKRKDAQAYCERVGREFGPACEVLFGVGTKRFSSN